MEWETVKALTGVVVVAGATASGLIGYGVWRAKLVSKKELYEQLYKDGTTIFIPRTECRELMVDKENQICKKLDKLFEFQKQIHEEQKAYQNKHSAKHDDIHNFMGEMRAEIKRLDRRRGEDNE